MKRATKTDYVKLHYKELAKQCNPKDFWGQVKRTVDGKPIDQAQIDLIESAVRKGLKLNKEDCLLDIGCGNGALSALFFDSISSFIGIDYSDYLISVARDNFERAPKHTFHRGDANLFIKRLKNKSKITKVLSYGTFQYFSTRVAENILTNLNTQYKNVGRIFLGNLPDKDRADKFYYKDIDYTDLLDDSKSPIGLWRTRDEFTKLADKSGWKVSYHNMPAGFHGSHYRFDAILTRR